MNRIYHNPRCSKSRCALQLLQDSGVEIETIPYLETPPSVRELDEICRQLGVEPTALVRTKERRFKELGLNLSDNRSRQEWLEVMSTNPVLIERPIFVTGDRAVIGRPPEKVIELLQSENGL